MVKKRGCVFLSVLFICLFSSQVISSNESSFLILEDNASEIGRIWGKENKNSILSAYNSFMAASGLTQGEITHISNNFINVTNALNISHWIDEANAIADEVGIPRDGYITFMARRYGGLACTSFIAVPPATKNNQIIFHKTRDNFEEPQAAYFKHTTGLPQDHRVYKFFASMGTPDTGLSYFVNEKGLAGSADWAGGHASSPKYDGIYSQHMLRYLAEHCENVSEVSDAIHYIVENGYSAEGPYTVSFLFADKNGDVLFIEEDGTQVVTEDTDLWTYFNGQWYEGIYFTRQRPSTIEALLDRYGDIDVKYADSTQVGKNSGITFSTSISGMTTLIDPVYPENLTSIFISLPAKAYSVPILFGSNEVPRALMNGEVYAKSQYTAGGSSKTADSYVEVANPSFDYTDKMTVAAWVKTTSGGYKVIAIKAIESGSYRGYALRMENGKAKFIPWNSGGLQLLGSSMINDGEWHHVVGTLDGSNAYLYVDGHLENSDSFSASVDNSENFYMGYGDVGGWSGEYWIGLIDEVCVFNEDLNDTEINDLKNNGPNLDDGRLVAYYSFDDVSGGNVLDDSFNNNNGIAYDATVVSGISGKALKFGMIILNDTLEIEIYNEWENFYNDMKNKLILGEEIINYLNEKILYFIDKVIGSRIPGDYLAYWKFEGNALDETGNNDGIVYGANYVVGIQGQGIGFDGINDYVSIGDLDPSEISVSSWVKLKSADAWAGFIMQSNVQWSEGYGFYAHSDNTINFFVDEWEDGVSTSFSTDNEWHHVVGTYDGSVLKLFVDNIDVNSVNYTGSTSSTEILEIGRGFKDSWNFFGDIDEVMIYDRALTLEEVGYIYDEQKQQLTCQDLDGDGYGIGLGCLDSDCNDNNANINPGASEICNGIDDNCDSQIDESNGDCYGATPYCVSGSCVECVGASDCDDGVYCNGDENCVGNVCQAGSDPCPGQYCDETGDTCYECEDNADCDDGQFCNGGETCVSGTCQAGADPCPGESCDEGIDECVECVGASDCDDGVYCNGDESCVGNVCQAGTPVNCNDGIGCTIDSCNEGTDTCDNTPDHGFCGDVYFCNGAEICDAQSGCQDGSDPCPGQYCDETGDTCYECEDNADCDDGQFCNGAETCVSGTCQAGADPCSGESCDEGIDECVGGPVAKLEAGSVNVGGDTVTLNLVNSYISPIVACAIHYANNSTPMVARVTDVTSSSFDVYLQNPSGGLVSAENVSYLVVEEGVWTIDGLKIEAQKYLSTVTDENNSWVGEAQTYGQSYTSPIVIGQVMSTNDPDWSVFWCQGPNRNAPPSATALRTGKTVCEDSDTTRADEMVGVIVFEAGHGSIGGIAYETSLGADSIRGIGNSPPYAYTFNTAFGSASTLALTTMAGMDGGNGGWSYTYGATMATETTLYLAIDEDQVKDLERRHTTEQVGYIVFESPVVYSE